MAVIAQMFEDGAGRPDRRSELARLRSLIQETGTGPERRVVVSADGRDGDGDDDGNDVADDRVPVLAGLRALLPGGALARGSVVAVVDRVAPWPDNAGTPSYLALALSVGATAGGAWVAAVGLPAFGVSAAVGLGADLGRLLLVDDPGERWAEAVAVLAGAVDLILVRPPRRPTAEHARRITARLRTTARQRGAVLVVAGPWNGAHLTLRTTEVAWTGLGIGTGHLTGRRVTVVAEGRGMNGRSRVAKLWLPASDGTIAEQRQQKQQTQQRQEHQDDRAQSDAQRRIQSA